jgi:hypothetical protein
MFGGHVLNAHVVGGTATGPEQVRHSYVTWDPAERHYSLFTIDSTGDVGTVELDWDGDSWLVGTTAEVRDRQPVVGTTLVELGPDGLRRVVTGALVAGGEPLGWVVLRYRKTGGDKR